jgi:hypothetical protein
MNRTDRSPVLQGPGDGVGSALTLASQHPRQFTKDLNWNNNVRRIQGGNQRNGGGCARRVIQCFGISEDVGVQRDEHDQSSPYAQSR